jgi:Holliday junction resolvase-like predicted endonuclease
MNMIQRFITKWQKNNSEVKEHSAKALRPKTDKQKLAQAGETFASEYLRNLGWKIVGRNWRSGRHCEIDIITKDKTGTLVFVEVKARRMHRKELGFVSSGFDCIDGPKKRKITTGALNYLAKHNLAEHTYRFDAIVLYYSAPFGDDLSLPTEVIHVKGIF